MSDRVHLFIEGRVQGVGFRYATYAQANALGLTGWVRNLSDGRVEAEFEGPKPVLEEMVAWCQAGPPFAHVRHVESAWESGPPRHKDFHFRG